MDDGRTPEHEYPITSPMSSGELKTGKSGVGIKTIKSGNDKIICCGDLLESPRDR